MDIVVHQRPRARDERRGRLKSATIAGLVTLACLIAVPVELLEPGFASIGLSELMPVLAPPIGWPVRIALALCGAAIAAGLAGGTGGEGVLAVGKGVGPGKKGNGIMGWTRNLGLHHLARLARGGEDAGKAYASSPMLINKMRSPRFATQVEGPAPDLLRRSRKDMHPDAPPRAPLIASRDLPGIVELSVIEAGPDVAPPPPPIACASPIRDTTSEARPRPLPRSPAPLSDSDLSWVRALLAARNQANEQPGEAQGLVSEAPVSLEVVSLGVPVTATGAGASVSLLSMVDRFEQGVTQRIALLDAANAIERAEQSLTGQHVTPAAAPAFAGEAGAEVGVEEGQNVPQEIDEALGAALETLRKLSVKANGR